METKAATPTVETEKSILVPIDYSDYSRNAVRFAMHLAHNLNARVYLFHAYYLPAIEIAEISWQTFSFTSIKDEVLSNLELGEQELIKKFEDNVRDEFSEHARNIKLDHILMPGIPDEELLKFTRTYKPLMIVLGINTFSKKSRQMFSNTSDIIIKRSKVPVAILPDNYNMAKLTKACSVGLITHFDESDFESIRKIMLLTQGMHCALKCLHVTNTPNNSWENIKLVGLQEYFKKVYEKEDVSCQTIESKIFLQELQLKAEQNDIDMLAFTLKKRNIISRLVKSDISKRMIKNIQVPQIIFH